MKKIISRETLLAYPNFNEEFHIQTDASHTQLGAVISQNKKPIAFYSRKLSDAQTRYTTTERELLAIVETLKELRNILLGQRIRVFTDHLNLTYKNFNTERVMRWQLILEEYGPVLEYIKGENNVVADALSRLHIDKTPTNRIETEKPTVSYLAEYYGLDDVDLPNDAYPLKFSLIDKEQKRDIHLLNKIKKNPAYTTKIFHGGGKSYDLIVKHGKIVIPRTLQSRTIKWYHEQLCHPGISRTESTIRQHYTFRNLSQMVKDHVRKCPTCQTCKKSPGQKYVHVPVKTAEAEPWDKLCVDLIGPYSVKRKGKKKLTLWAVTMIDPATGWFEMKEIKDKTAINVADVVEQTWLTRYPWPTQIVYDKGTEFLAEFAKMIKDDYGIRKSPASVRNPQANSILERIHQTIGNVIRTFKFDEKYMDPSDPFSGILAATMFATRATYHTTTRATPTQLVFGRDAIANIKFEADWNLIRQRKQEMIRRNNIKENSKRIDHDYHVGDKVLLRNDDLAKFQSNPWEGPFRIAAVKDNGNVRVDKGSTIEPFNVRLLKPYIE